MTPSSPRENSDVEMRHEGGEAAGASAATAAVAGPSSSSPVASASRKRPRRSRSRSRSCGDDNNDGEHFSSPSRKQQRLGASADPSSSSLSASLDTSSASAATGTGTSPPRRPRQPPMSQAAWTSLADGASAAAAATATTAMTGTAATASPHTDRRSSAGHHGAAAPVHAPTDIFSRNVARGSAAGDGDANGASSPPASLHDVHRSGQAPATANAQNQTPPTASAHAHRRLAVPLPFPRRRSATAGAARATMPGVFPHHRQSGMAIPVYPGSVLGALMHDIMGYYARRLDAASGAANGAAAGAAAAAAAAAATPVTAGTNTMPASSSSSSLSSSSGTNTMPTSSDNAPAAATSNATSSSTSTSNSSSSDGRPAGPVPVAPQQPPTALPSPATMPSAGGTSILIQGAMISRLLRRDAPATTASGGEGDSTSTGAGNAQEGGSSTADRAQGHSSSEQVGSTDDLSSAQDNNRPLSSSLASASERVPSTDDVSGAQGGASSTETSEHDHTTADAPGAQDGPSSTSAPSSSSAPEQPPPTDDDAATPSDTAEAGTLEEQAAMLCRLTSIATAATAASLISGQSTTARDAAMTAAGAAPQDARGGETAASASTNAPTSTSTSMSTSPSPSFNYAARALSAINGVLHRLARVASSTMQPTLPPALLPHLWPDSGLNPSQDDRYNDEDAAAIDRSLGPGMQAHGSSSGRGGSAAGPSASNPDVSLSDMIHEAIRAHSRREDGGDGDDVDEDEDSGDGNDDAGDAPASAQPLHAHLAQVLQSVRENRLDSHGTASVGSFERWLSDTSGELNAAVRAMADANGIVVARGEGGASTSASNASASASAGAGARTANAGENARTASNPTAGAAADATSNSSTDPNASGSASASALCTDLEQGRLRFFRLFRFPTDAHRADFESDPQILATRPPAGLVPCIIVAVNSNPVVGGGGGLADGGDFSDLGGGSEANNGSATSGATPTPTAAGSTTSHTSSAAARWHTSRFNMFVCGGHFSPSHPLLVAPHHIASRDVMNFMRILAAHSALSGRAEGLRTATSPVNDAELAASGLVTKKWSEIKQVAVSADAKEGQQTTATGAAQSGLVSAVRSGDTCNICLEEWADEDTVRVLGCRHVYHAGCVDQWLKGSSNSCPMCRHVVVQRGGASTTSTTSAASGAGGAGGASGAGAASGGEAAGSGSGGGGAAGPAAGGGFGGGFF